MIKKRYFISIKYKMTISLLGMTMIPLILVGYISYKQIDKITGDKFINSKQNSVNQISDNIQFIINDIIDLTLYIIQDNKIRDFFSIASNLKENERQLLTLEVNNSISNFAYTNNHIHSIEIDYPGKEKIETQYSKLKINSDVRKIVTALDGYFYWFFDHTPEPDKMYYLSVVRMIKDINNLSSDLAILRINILEDYISDIFNITNNDAENYYIINSKNEIIAANKKSDLAKTIKLKRPEGNDDKTSYYTEISGIKYLITFSDLENCDWTVVNMASYDELIESKMIILRSIILGILASITLCLATILYFNLKVLNPLKQFKYLMNRIENSDFDIIASEEGNDEFAQLGHSFNKMSKKLKELMYEIKITANRKKAAELKVLESQINPHFLYNTLDTIYWKARLEKAFETSSLVEALSKLFRLSLNKGNEMTTVRTEIENLNKYIFIQKHRYSDLINFNITASNEVLECKVLKLVLQPLVENSIYHGLKERGISGEININIYRIEKELIYDVEDSGVGVDIELLNNFLIDNNDQPKSSIGIKNVHDRIRLYNGSNFGLSFLEVDKGTFVRVKQPFIY